LPFWQIFSIRKLLFFYALSLLECAPDQSAIFVGIIVSVLNVFLYTPSAPPPNRRDIIFDLNGILKSFLYFVIPGSIRHPVALIFIFWIPAYAGMTTFMRLW
jgi:hypothetical protein